jgi:hypothetical protein
VGTDVKTFIMPRQGSTNQSFEERTPNKRKNRMQLQKKKQSKNKEKP